MCLAGSWREASFSTTLLSPPISPLSLGHTLSHQMAAIHSSPPTSRWWRHHYRYCRPSPAVCPSSLCPVMGTCPPSRAVCSASHTKLLSEFMQYSGISLRLESNYYCVTSLIWTPLGQKKVSSLVRCLDFRGCNAHKQGVWDSQMCPVY